MTILLIEKSRETVCHSCEWVLIKSLRDHPQRSLSSDHSQDNHEDNNTSHASTSPDETIPMTNAIVDVNSLPTINANMNSQSSSTATNGIVDVNSLPTINANMNSQSSSTATNGIVDVNSLPTINANMNSHSSSKTFNLEPSSFTPFLGPPHMIPPPPNIVIQPQILPTPSAPPSSLSSAQSYADILSSGIAQHCPTDQPEVMTLGAASPQYSSFIRLNVV